METTFDLEKTCADEVEYFVGNTGFILKSHELSWTLELDDNVEILFDKVKRSYSAHQHQIFDTQYSAIRRIKDWYQQAEDRHLHELLWDAQFINSPTFNVYGEQL